MFEKYGKDYIQNLINESTSIREVLLKLGLKGEGGNHTKFSQYIKENNFDTSTLVGRALKKYSNKGIPKKTLSENLVENGSRNSQKIKIRLVREGVKKWECEKCGISEWNDMPIMLELHHINGNHFDNRLENLLLLCPNCHSQTSNFRGKNLQYDKDLANIAKKNSEGKMEELKKNEAKRKEEIYQNKIYWGEIPKGVRKERKIKYCEVCGKEIKKGAKRFCSYECSYKASRNNNYTKEQLLSDCEKVTSLVQLGKMYNVTDNAIKKQLKRLGILETVKDIFRKNKNKN